MFLTVSCGGDTTDRNLIIEEEDDSRIVNLMNPDTIRTLGEEGKLTELSDLACADNLRDVVKMANVVNGN